QALAVDWAQRCDLRLDQAVNHNREREYLTLVRVLIRQRQLEPARQWLARLLQLAEAQGRTGSVIEIVMLQAEACQASGDRPAATDRLTRALALAEPQGYVRLFVDEGAPMAHLLQQLPSRPGQPQPSQSSYRAQLLALLSMPPDEKTPLAA